MSGHTNIVVGIDFDGTLAARGPDPYPAIGRDLGAAPWLHGLVHNPRVELILWTMREGYALAMALAWCTERHITFDACNEVPGQAEWADHTDGPCRKQHFSILVDDCALGVPLVRPASLEVFEPIPGYKPKPFVDWGKAGPMLIRTVNMWSRDHPLEEVPAPPPQPRRTTRLDDDEYDARRG
jgi:hypothetical protein